MPVVGILFALVLGACSSGGAPRPSISSNVANGFAMPVARDTPCGDVGSPTTLDQAIARAPYTILVPQDSLADPSNLSKVCMLGSATEVELLFPSGIAILQQVNDIKDPASSWEALAAQDPQDTSVGSIGGIPAAVIDPAKSSGGALGSVSLVKDGTWIVVVGNGKISAADLERVAASLIPAALPVRASPSALPTPTWFPVTTGTLLP